MTFEYFYSSNVASKKDLLQWFFPNITVKTSFYIDTLNSKLVQLRRKNKSISKLMKTLDLIEVRKN